MAAAGLNNLTGTGVLVLGCSGLFSDRFTRAIRDAEKERGGKKRKEKRITVAAANNTVLASNTFYF